jgi:hypothetical protein
MNREFVAVTVNERESRLWRVRLDKYLRPDRVEPIHDGSIRDGHEIDLDECVVVEVANPAPTPNEVLALLRRRYMYEHRRSA